MSPPRRSSLGLTVFSVAEPRRRRARARPWKPAGSASRRSVSQRGSCCGRAAGMRSDATGVLVTNDRGDGGRPAEAWIGQAGDRAKTALLWPDPSRNGRKLAEIAGLRPGLRRRRNPANKPNSGLAHAWIAPRRSPVRVRLAPSREPAAIAGFLRSGVVAFACRRRLVGPVFGPVEGLRQYSALR
jgi:hypothetical protein